MTTAPAPPAVPPAVASAAGRRGLGVPRRVHAVPSRRETLVRALVIVAAGLAAVLLGIWTQLDVVRIIGLLLLIGAFVYAISVRSRVGQVAVVYDEGIVHTSRDGTVAMRWSDVVAFDVVKKRSAETMLGQPNHSLRSRDGSTILISGFVVGAKELGAELRRRYPA